MARRIGEFHLVLAATPAYLKRHGTPSHPRDIEDGDHKVVNYFSHRTGQPFYVRASGQRGAYCVECCNSKGE